MNGFPKTINTVNYKGWKLGVTWNINDEEKKVDRRISKILKKNNSMSNNSNIAFDELIKNLCHGNF